MSSGTSSGSSSCLSFATGLSKDHVKVVMEVLKGREMSIDEKERVIGVCLEHKDDLQRIYKEWKKEIALQRVKEIIGHHLIGDEELGNFLMRLKDPVVRGDFFQWCEAAFTENNDWPEGYVFEEARKLLTPRKTEEPDSNGSPDDFVHVPNLPVAPVPQKRGESLPQRDKPTPAPVYPDDGGSLVSPGDVEKDESKLEKAPRGIKTTPGTRGTKVSGQRSSLMKIKTRTEPLEDEPKEEAKEEKTKKPKVLPDANLDNYNILLVGDSGVGKTTFINGVANYFEYDSWEEILEYGPDVRIDTQFTLLNLDNQPVNVVTKSCYETTDEERKNENAGTEGQSVTQEPITHTFHVTRENRTINVNIIDTPGMNDTRGSKQDQLNLQKIIDHIRGLKQLNAIVLVLAADQPRMTPQFRHSLNELLTNFDKTSLKNLLFCYTRARAFGYKPGDALATLREFLTEQAKRSGVTIPVETGNVFCIDNDCFRYLCMIQQFPSCESDKMDKEFAECWKHNYRELKRWLKRVGELKPYKLEESADITKLQLMLETLASPQEKMAREAVRYAKHLDNVVYRMEMYNSSQYRSSSSRNSSHPTTSSKPSEEDLVENLSYYTTAVDEMKRERNVILDLCAEICTHISYKSPNKTIDVFRMALIHYLEAAEKNVTVGGDPALVKEMQSALGYYEARLGEIKTDVEEKRRNILTEHELENHMAGLKHLKHYREMLPILYFQ